LEIFFDGLNERLWDEESEGDANCWASKDVGKGDDPVEGEKPARIELNHGTVTARPHQKAKKQPLKFGKNLLSCFIILAK